MGDDATVYETWSKGLELLIGDLNFRQPVGLVKCSRSSCVAIRSRILNTKGKQIFSDDTACARARSRRRARGRGVRCRFSRG